MQEAHLLLEALVEVGRAAALLEHRVRHLVAGRGGASRLTSSDTWYSKLVRGIGTHLHHVVRVVLHRLEQPLLGDLPQGVGSGWVRGADRPRCFSSKRPEADAAGVLCIGFVQSVLNKTVHINSTVNNCTKLHLRPADRTSPQIEQV